MQSTYKIRRVDDGKEVGGVIVLDGQFVEVTFYTINMAGQKIVEKTMLVPTEDKRRSPRIR